MFTELFVELLQKKQLSAYKVAKDTGISQGLMNEYKNGVKLPTIQNLIKIAEYLQVPTDYLLGLSSQKENLIKSKENIMSEEQHDKRSFQKIVKLGLYNFFRHFNTLDKDCLSDYSILSSKTGIDKDRLKSFYVDANILNVIDNETIEIICPTYKEFFKMMKFNSYAREYSECVDLLFALEEYAEDKIFSEDEIRRIVRQELIMQDTYSRIDSRAN